jgi:hypothetical protein
MTWWLIAGAVLGVIILCTRSVRAYTPHDGPYMTEDGWKHSYSEEQPDGSWTNDNRHWTRDDPWKD